MVTCMICSFYLWHYSPAYLGISFIQDLHSIFFFSTCGHPCHPGFSVDSSGGTDSCSGHYAYLTTSHLDEVWQSNVSDSHVAARLAYQGCLESQILVSFFTNVLSRAVESFNLNLCRLARHTIILVMKKITRPHTIFSPFLFIPSLRTGSAAAQVSNQQLMSAKLHLFRRTGDKISLIIFMRDDERQTHPPSLVLMHTLLSVSTSALHSIR